jgi:uncharacterized protein YecE (DUF72 family)
MAEAAEVLVGTSGYSYQDWVGPVYPPGTPRRDFLSRYAEEFSFTELNFSYYSLPAASTLERMVEKTPESFLFAIKAHKSITHEPGTDEDVDRFRAAVAPLAGAARLAAVLLQFPYSFHYTGERRVYLDRVCRRMEELPLAVEFRNDEWHRESVLQAFRERGIAFVNVDAPGLPRLPPPTAAATADTAYIRFHGRNREQWWKGDATSRYDYLYAPEELSEWIDRIMAVVGRAKVLLIAFNNHFRGQSFTNARMLRSLLGKRIPVR